MSGSPIIGPCEKPQPPQRVFLYDGRCFRPAETQKWAESSSDEPWTELHWLPGTNPIWVLVDLPLLWSNLPCARQVSEPEAATFLLLNGHDLPDELRAAAESLHLIQATSGSAGVVPAPPPPQPSPVPTDLSHSPDFRSVGVGETLFTFTPVQAACVRVLYEAWERGAPEVGQETILDKAGAESTRLADLFKGHRSWRTLIVAGSTRGAFKLALPRR
jgi:hypothetical protein